MPKKGKGKKKKKRRSPTSGIRSWIAVAAHNRGGAGSHGGSVRQKHKRGRKAAKQELKGRVVDDHTEAD